MDAILHFIGLCGDTALHIDLIDIFILSGIDIGVLDYLKNTLKNIFE